MPAARLTASAVFQLFRGVATGVTVYGVALVLTLLIDVSFTQAGTTTLTGDGSPLFIEVDQVTLLNGGARIVYASTSGVYGKSAIEEAVSEEFHVSPKSSYAIAKRYNEIYLASLFAEKNLPSVSLRFFHVYGVNQDSRMVVPRFFEHAMRGEPLTVFGTGEQTRDFTYIDDVIEATVRVANMVDGCEIVNISNEQEYRIRDLAETIVELTGSSSPITYLTPPENRYDFEVERRLGSSQKLFDLTGFRPATPLADGLEWIHSHLVHAGAATKRRS